MLVGIGLGSPGVWAAAGTAGTDAQRGQKTTPVAAFGMETDLLRAGSVGWARSWFQRAAGREDLDASTRRAFPPGATAVTSSRGTSSPARRPGARRRCARRRRAAPAGWRRSPPRPGGSAAGAEHHPQQPALGVPGDLVRGSAACSASSGTGPGPRARPPPPGPCRSPRRWGPAATAWPRSMKATCSHSVSSSGRLCEEITTVRPAARPRRSSSRISWAWRGSRPLVGSSSSTSAGVADERLGHRQPAQHPVRQRLGPGAASCRPAPPPPAGARRRGGPAARRVPAGARSR